MLQLKGNTLIISIILLALVSFVFLPFSLAFDYAIISADDYTRALYDLNDFAKNYSFWYNKHNGRFVNAFLALLPVYNSYLLNIILVLNFLLNFAVIRYFFIQLCAFSDLKSSDLTIFFLTAVVFCLVITQMPSLVDYFYWYAAMTVYSVSFLSFLLMMAFTMKSLKGHSYSIVWAMFFAMVAVGSNEIFILLLNFLICFVLLYYFLRYRIIKTQIILLEVVTIASSLIVVLSPGSSSRKQAFADSGDFFQAVNVTIRELKFFLANEFSNVQDYLTYTIILISILIMFQLDSSQIKRKYLNPFLLLFLSLILVIGILFTPSYAMGGQIFNFGRIGNLIHLLWLAIITINFFNLGLYLSNKKLLKGILKNNTLLFLISILLFISIYRSSNIRGVYADFYHDTFEKIKAQQKSRLLTIKSSNQRDLILEPLPSSRTLPYSDITKDPKHWKNISYVEYINKKYHLDISSIIINSETAQDQ